uniref:G-protein coupled receptors family 1 profile domain-containing protein n=1 Tax=Malurus cyaneus samueli TaxID=2593467 RepID=A0A8C5T2P1_9PASS
TSIPVPPAAPASLCCWRDHDPQGRETRNGRNCEEREARLGHSAGKELAVDGVMLLISLVGLVGNGAVLCLLHRKPSTFYITNLAFADFTFLHFAVPSTLLYLLEELSCSIVVPLMFQKALFPLLLLSYNLGLSLLMAIGVERCTSILHPLWYRCHRPQRLSWVVCALLWALSVTFIVTVTYLCQSQEHGYCQVALISMYSLNLFLFAPAMVISSTILFIKVKCGPQPKRFDIVIFLTVFSFLLFVVFLLACIHSTTKPFTYFSVGSWRRPCSVEALRGSLQRVFEEPEGSTAIPLTPGSCTPLRSDINKEHREP